LISSPFLPSLQRFSSNRVTDARELFEKETERRRKVFECWKVQSAREFSYFVTESWLRKWASLDLFRPEPEPELERGSGSPKTTQHAPQNGQGIS